MSRHNRDRRRPKLPKYAPDVLRAAQQAMAAGRIVPGRVSVVTVAHDDWCDLLAGRGPCTCTPEVRGGQLVPSPEDN